jgi:hypothetical protein
VEAQAENEYILGGLDSETNVALGVTDEDNGLETGTLTGTGLLLDGLGYGSTHTF